MAQRELFLSANCFKIIARLLVQINKSDGIMSGTGALANEKNERLLDCSYSRAPFSSRANTFK